VPGCTVSIGDVALRLQQAGQPLPAAGAAAPARAPSAKATAATPTRETPTLAATAAPAAQPAAPAAPVVYDQGEIKTGRLAMIMIIGAGALLVLAIAGWVALKQDTGPKVGTLRPVLVRVNENRLVLTSVVRVGNEPRPGGDIADDNQAIIVDDPEIASVTKYQYGPKAVVVAGRTSGSATAWLRTVSGNRIVLRILVRGQREDPLDWIERVPKVLELRRVQAEKRITTGDRLRSVSLFRATQEYIIARELMKPFNSYEPYGRAKDSIQKMNDLIDARYEELRNNVKQAWSTKDFDLADKQLQEMMQLVPDENDPRWQRAKMLRDDVLLEIAATGRRRR